MSIPTNYTDLTPASWPARPGQLGVLLTQPHKGFAVEVVAVEGWRASVRFLDSPVDSETFTRPLFSVLPTGKTVDSLSARYEPTPHSLDAAVDEERDLPDFTLLKPRKAVGSKAKADKKPKELNEGQKEQLKRMVMKALEEMKGGD